MLVREVVTISLHAHCQDAVKIISVMKFCILHLFGNLITCYGFAMVKWLVRVNWVKESVRELPDWVKALVCCHGKMSQAGEPSKDTETITVMDPQCTVHKKYKAQSGDRIVR